MNLYKIPTGLHSLVGKKNEKTIYCFVILPNFTAAQNELTLIKLRVFIKNYLIFTIYL